MGEIIATMIMFVACSIIMVTIGGVITGEYVSLDRYSETNCSGIDNTYIGNTLGYYHCHGYAKVYRNNVQIGTVKLENPPYNPLIVKVTEAQCNSWISSLNDDKFHTCYVDNMYSQNSVGYTSLQSVAGYIAMMAIGAIIIAFCVIGMILTILDNTCKRFN